MKLGKFLIFIFCIVIGNNYAQEKSVSPFNKLPVKIDSTNNYSVIISGHFHGSGANKTGYPANTLLANIDTLNQLKSNFMVCLGDMFLSIRHDRAFYENALFSKLKMPLFNTVGNHDLSGDEYQKNYGSTFTFFELGNDIHVFFDTERNDGSIKGEQLQFLKDIDAKKSDFNNVFIYTHRTVWAKSYSELDKLFKDNTQSVFGNNFSDEVKPLVQSIASGSNVYWFSGSLGTAPASFFSFKDDNIQYIATAIRGLPRDAVLKSNIINGEVTFETISLTGQNLMTLDEYDVTYWEENVGVEPFNYRLLPYYAKLMVTHFYFWIGICIGVILMLVLKLLKKKKKA